MDDARGLGFVLGLDQQHQASVALGDDGLLHHRPLLVATEAALHYLVKLLVGGTGLTAQLPQFGAGVVQNLSGGTDGPADGLCQVTQVRDVGGHPCQQRQVFPAVESIAAETGGLGQLLNLVQFLATQGAAQHGPLHVLPQVGAGAKLQAAAVVQKKPGFVSLLKSGTDFQGVADRFQVQGTLPAQHGTGVSGQPLPNLVELQQVLRPGKAAQGSSRSCAIGVTIQLSP